MTFIKITTKITILACILDHFLCVRHVCAANYCLTKFTGQKKACSSLQRRQRGTGNLTDTHKEGYTKNNTKITRHVL